MTVDTPLNNNTFFLLLFKNFKISRSDGILILQRPSDTRNSNTLA